MSSRWYKCKMCSKIFQEAKSLISHKIEKHGFVIPPRGKEISNNVSTTVETVVTTAVVQNSPEHNDLQKFGNNNESEKLKEVHPKNYKVCNLNEHKDSENNSDTEHEDSKKNDESEIEIIDLCSESDNEETIDQEVIRNFIADKLKKYIETEITNAVSTSGRNESKDKLNEEDKNKTGVEEYESGSDERESESEENESNYEETHETEKLAIQSNIIVDSAVSVRSNEPHSSVSTYAGFEKFDKNCPPILEQVDRTIKFPSLIKNPNVPPVLVQQLSSHGISYSESLVNRANNNIQDSRVRQDNNSFEKNGDKKMPVLISVLNKKIRKKRKSSSILCKRIRKKRASSSCSSKKIECRYCPLDFSTLSKKKEHENEFHDIVSCPQCNKFFISKATLDYHLKNDHITEEKNSYSPSPSSSSSVSVCPICGRLDDGNPMIRCDHCLKWIHFSCQDIVEQQEPIGYWECTICVASSSAKISKKKVQKKLNSHSLKREQIITQVKSSAPTSTKGSDIKNANKSKQRRISKPCNICQHEGLPGDMVDCDSCVAIFHFGCVGLEAPPSKNESWYCDMCEQMNRREEKINGEIEEEALFNKLRNHRQIRTKYWSSSPECNPSDNKIQVTKTEQNTSRNVGKKVNQTKLRGTDRKIIFPIIFPRKRKNNNNQAAHFYGCSYCLKLFNLKETLTTHMLIHSEKSGTSVSCRDKYAYARVIEKKDVYLFKIPSSLSCSICGSKFRKVLDQMIHIAGHAEENRRQCPFCPYSTFISRTSDLFKHIDNKHRDIENPKTEQKLTNPKSKHVQSSSHIPINKSKKENKVHKCCVCEKSFTSLWHWKNHVQQHETNRPYKCPYCSIRYRHSKSVYTHVIRHHPDKKSEEYTKIVVIP